MDENAKEPVRVVEAEASTSARLASESSARAIPLAAVWGSPDAIFHAHYSRLVEAIAAATGDDDGSADAVQEAFVQLWRHWDDVQLYEDPVGWVRRVAINRAFNRRRSLARRTAALLRLAEREQSTGAIVAGEPWEPSLMAAFRGLPARQRLAMGLYYVADLSVAEVASAMGVGEGSVKQHLHRGREALRHSLEAEQ